MVKRYLFACLLVVVGIGTLLAFSSLTFADSIEERTSQALIAFNVIHDQFAFNFKNIKSASIIEQNGQFQGLRVQLKPYAIESFKRITTAGLGKVAILVVNNKIVSSTTIESPLSGDIMIKSITRGEAQDIINKLKLYQSVLQ